MDTLQKFLLGNALFSFTSGISALLFPESFSEIFGLENSTPFWILGIGLLFFSGLVFRESRRKSLTGTLFIVVQDLVWVLGSLVILLWKPFGISFEGNLIVAAVMLVVFFFAIGQSTALAQAGEGPQKRTKRIHVQRTVKAQHADVWKVVSDVGNYHHFAPNIDGVRIISGSGENMVRSCSHGKDSWTETCTLWEEGKAFSFEVNTQAPDYPFPLRKLKGHWQVDSIAPKESRIGMTFDFQYKKRIYNLLLHPFMSKRFYKICEELLDNWEKELSNKAF